MLLLPSPAPILSAQFMSNIMARFMGLLRTPKRPAISRVVYVILLALLLGTGFAQRASAQINVSPNSEGNTLGAACSLQEAIYATEFGANVALDQTDPDDTYTTGCSDASGNWNTIVLPGGTLNFTKFWDGDAHNPFGPTATPIIFKTITIQGNGTTLQWAWTPATSPLPGNFRLFAIGEASISPTRGVLTSGTYSGTGNLTLQNVYVKSFNVKGGDGACAGGGGMGAGGAIYIGKTSSGTPSLTVENSTFSGNSATGGNGSIYPVNQCFATIQKGYFGGGGGGGLYGNGGNSGLGGGGGGGGGSRGNGGAGLSGAGGGGGGTVFDGTIAFQDPNIASRTLGGIGGYLYGGAGGPFDYNTVITGSGHSAVSPGAGGGGAAIVSTGGTGSYGGGGGGGGGSDNFEVGNAGNGGFGGGGGGAEGGDDQHIAASGNGGFGGGGGALFLDSSNGQGGAFGGSGGNIAGFPFSGSGGALGGAIFNDSGIVIVRNSTFFGNSAHGGVTPASSYPAPAQTAGLDAGAAIFSRNGMLTIQNATISGNTASATATGGGIVVMSDGGSASFRLDNTIVANNGAQECYVLNSVSLQGTSNLVMANDPSHGCPGVGPTSDPNLDALNLNSPGNTPTMAIHYGASPAIDAGDDGVVTATPALQTAQNGLTRPQGSHSDIGAYEAPPPTADLSLTKTVSSSTAQQGDTLSYTLGVSNAGPNDANSVAVTDTLPSSVSFVSCFAPGGTCAWDGATLTVTYSTLAASASATATITTTVKPGLSDALTVTNTASVGASSPTDPNANNNSTSVSFTVHNRADLAVAKTVTTTSPYSPKVEAGDSLTYTVTLTNKGPYDARSVVLSDSAPAGVTFTGCSSSVGTCVWSASQASLTLASLANAGVAKLNIQGTLNYSVADQALITNTASVSSTTYDPDLTNNSASASFTALNNSDLFVTQSSAKLASRQLQYTVNVKNLGNYLAKKLVLNDPLPAGSKFVSLNAGSWTCSAPAAGSTGTISCSLASEAVNVTQSITFVVKINTPGSVLVNNTPSVSAANFDPNLGNNTSALSTKVGP